ncbi:MAG: DUF3618 domain-containing protein [Stellaceae bacterium]
MARDYTDGPRRSAAEIERDLARTRAELSLTLDALRHKLTARHLLERGMDMVTQSIGDGQGIRIGFDGLRLSPIALALIGAGALWLVAANTGVLDTVVQDERVRAARERLTALTGRGGAPTGQGPSFVTNPALAAEDANRTGGWVHQATDAARGAMRAVRDTAGDYTGRPVGWLRERAGDYAGCAGQQASDLGSRMAETFERHPLLVGMAGVLAGVLAASLLPTTQVEDEWAGESRDRVAKRAGEVGREMLLRVRNSVDQSIDRAAGEPAPGATP